MLSILHPPCCGVAITLQLDPPWMAFLRLRHLFSDKSWLGNNRDSGSSRQTQQSNTRSTWKKQQPQLIDLTGNALLGLGSSHSLNSKPPTEPRFEPRAADSRTLRCKISNMQLLALGFKRYCGPCFPSSDHTRPRRGSTTTAQQSISQLFLTLVNRPQ
jgi:hypothetical protein